MQADTVTVLVRLELTVEEYAKAERIARARRKPRDEYLAGMLMREVRLTNLERRITHHQAAGLPDADIARETGIPVNRIAQVRRDLGLAANPRFTARRAS